jgi:hypothetical protein
MTQRLDQLLRHRTWDRGAVVARLYPILGTLALALLKQLMRSLKCVLVFTFSN